MANPVSAATQLSAVVDSVGNTFSGIGDTVTDSKGRTGTIQAVLPRDDNTVHFLVRFTFAFGAELARVSEQKLVSTLLTVVTRNDGAALGPPIQPSTAEKVLPTIGSTSEYLDRPF